MTRSALRDRILVEEDHSITTSNLQHAVETGTIYHAEYRIRTKDGSQCWLSATGMPTFAPDSTEVIGSIWKESRTASGEPLIAVPADFD